MRRDEDFDISNSLQNFVDSIFGFLPQLLGALLLLLVGYIIAKTVQKVLTKVLVRARFDRALHVSPAGKFINRIVESPASLLGRIAFFVIMLLVISISVSTLDIQALNNIVDGIFSYIPKVIAAIAIFLVASAITAGAEVFIYKVLGNHPMTKVIGAVLPAITLSIAVFMILNQLEIATEIVNITYTAILGSLALGLALAFGLGGRDVAAQILSNAYDNAQAKKPMMKDAARTAKENSKQMAQDARDNAS
jgi:hypothetical protein